MFSFFKRLESSGSIKWIVAGLGNPGSKYEKTRHNVGFITLDLLASQWDANVNRLRFRALSGECVIGGERTLLLKPQTFMNNSGEAVREALAWYKITPERLIVVSDDVNLAPGRIRIRAKGSDGGHNGLKSIIYHINTDAFARIRVGVGSPENPGYNMPDWVLGTFDAKDGAAVTDAIKRAAGAVADIIKNGCEHAAGEYNGSVFNPPAR